MGPPPPREKKTAVGTSKGTDTRKGGADSRGTRTSPIPSALGGARNSEPPSLFDAFVRYAILVVLVVGVVGAAIMGFLFVMQLRRARPLREALTMLATEDPKFHEVEALLRKALEAGLDKSDVATARFALAYVRARLGRFADASSVLSDLDAAFRDRESTYLELWLLSKQGQNERIETLYREHSPLLANAHQTKLIVAMAYLDRARKFWAAKQVESAVSYFAKLRELGTLVDEIPEHVDDHEIVLGISALLEKSYEDAERHFRGAVDASKVSNKSSVPGDLGLLLCEWKKTDVPDVDSRLGDVVARLEADNPTAGPHGLVRCDHCNAQFRVVVRMQGRRVECPSCEKAFRVPAGLKPLEGDAADRESDRERIQGDDEKLLQNSLLWHAVSLLFRWQRSTRGKKRFERRASAAELELPGSRRSGGINPKLADPKLLGHLIAYYFATSEEGRALAVKGLDAASKNIRVPEVLDLIQREKRLEQYKQDGLARFYAYVHNYLGDGRVPEKHRADLKERLRRFRRFKDAVASDGTEEETAPSLEDLQTRSQSLRERVCGDWNGV